MQTRTKKVIQYSLTFLLVVASMWLAVKDVNIKLLFHEITSINLLWVLLSIPVILMSHWVRAMRWKTMLIPALKLEKVSTFDLFSSVMIGYMFNCILPRGGEFIRPYVYSRREKISFSSVFATIVFERFFLDVVTLILVFIAGMLLFSNRLLSALPNLNVNMVVIPTILLFTVLLFCFYPPVFSWIIEKTVKPFSDRIYKRLHNIFEKFLIGFAVIKTPSRYFRLFIESVIIWFLYTVPMYLMFYSFGFQTTYNLGFDDAILLIIISGVGVTIAPTPGAFGVYHLLIQNALVKLYGIPAESALAYATVTHGINYFVQVFVGGLFAFRERKYISNLSILDKLKKQEEELGLN